MTRIRGGGGYDDDDDVCWMEGWVYRYADIKVFLCQSKSLNAVAKILLLGPYRESKPGRSAHTYFSHPGPQLQKNLHYGT